MFTTIWERYFLRETTKVIIFFMFTFYGLYILIDYSVHASAFHGSRFGFFDIASYYLCEFFNRLNILLPFALMIASIKTVSTLVMNHELVALMAGGISLRKLMRPFLFLGLLGTAIMYLNAQYFLPAALKELNTLEARQISKKYKPKANVQNITLDDGSLLLYQSYNHEDKSFFDVFWVRSASDIYRIKTLYPFGDVPQGNYVDHFTRDLGGELQHNASFSQTTFSELIVPKSKLKQTQAGPEDLSISKLAHQYPRGVASFDEKQSQIATTLYQKIAMPWLCLLAIIGPIPFCLRFTRQYPLFFVYAGSIFGLVAFSLVLSAAAVLGTRQVISPFWAIWGPFLLFSGALTTNYTRIEA